MKSEHPDEQRYLLLDNRIIEDTEKTELTLGTVEKHPSNPLFGEDKPWEARFDNLYANIIYDNEENLYKCWYSPFIVDNSALGMSLDERRQRYWAPENREMALCYATSLDGIVWEKPELGLVEFEGTKANNILWRGEVRREDEAKKVWRGPHGTGVFKDLREPDPNRRYKALLKSNILSIAYSKDGIHWDPAIACPEADSAGDTHNNALWSDDLEKYVGITRQWGKSSEKHVRQVARTSSDDFENWEKTEIVLEGLDSTKQLYSMPIFHHAGLYLGIVAIHDQDTDRVWAELTWSPDTRKWRRILPGVPFIANEGNEFDYDWGCIYTAANPVFLEDEIRVYYGASDGLHTGWRNGFLCLATIRPDGFAGYSAGREEASITTTPVLNGDQFKVSADIQHDGELMVRLLNDEKAIVCESQVFTNSVTDEPVVWQIKKEAHDIKNGRLEFVFRNAMIYSFCSQL